MELGQLIILSIVEGISEFLPISSTGHLILASKLLNIPQTEFIKTFEISIQLGAILSVLFLFGRKILLDLEILKRIIWVFVPTGVLGFILYKLIKSYLIGNLLVTVLALILGGIAIIYLEKMVITKQGKIQIQDLSLKKSVLLGVIQTLSVIPGVSRSATTIFGGMYLGLSRQAATELSFLVALPVMIAAVGFDLIKSFNTIDNFDLITIALGIAISFLVALLSIKWLVKFAATHNFFYFGVYRIIIGIIFLIFYLD